MPGPPMLKLQKIYEFPQMPAELNYHIWEYIESEYRQKVRAVFDNVMRQLLQKTRVIWELHNTNLIKDHWHIIHMPDHMQRNKMVLSAWEYSSHRRRSMKCTFNVNFDQRIHRSRFYETLMIIRIGFSPIWRSTLSRKCRIACISPFFVLQR